MSVKIEPILMRPVLPPVETTDTDGRWHASRGPVSVPPVSTVQAQVLPNTPQLVVPQ
jgi:hypothetical protein